MEKVKILLCLKMPISGLKGDGHSYLRQSENDSTANLEMQ